MSAPIVDLRSDTLTQPSAAMRQAMANAEVGDDVYGEDPTVNRLEAVAAERLDKEAAVYVPSGTMANQLAIRCHTQPGDEILVYEGGHPLHYEAGGAAIISGVLIRTLPGRGGVMSPDAVAGMFRVEDDHFAPLSLVTVEDTTNRGGGTIWPLEQLDGVAEVTHAKGAATHMDGARLFNAVVGSGVPAARRTAGYDTVSFCLSKGLGAPVGSLLCGPKDLIKRARRFRKALGGGMRQAGILAAGGLYALEHNVDRLSDDHERARALGHGLADLGVTVAPVHTNMVYLTVPDAPAMVNALAGLGVRANWVHETQIRLVTHLDVDDAGVDRALAAFAQLLQA